MNNRSLPSLGLHSLFAVLAVLGLANCGANKFQNSSATESSTSVAAVSSSDGAPNLVSSGGPSKIDVVIVVDNSESMIPSQAATQAVVSKIISSQGSRANVHTALIASTFVTQFTAGVISPLNDVNHIQIPEYVGSCHAYAAFMTDLKNSIALSNFLRADAKLVVIAVTDCKVPANSVPPYIGKYIGTTYPQNMTFDGLSAGGDDYDSLVSQTNGVLQPFAGQSFDAFSTAVISQLSSM